MENHIADTPPFVITMLLTEKILEDIPDRQRNKIVAKYIIRYLETCATMKTARNIVDGICDPNIPRPVSNVIWMRLREMATKGTIIREKKNSSCIVTVQDVTVIQERELWHFSLPDFIPSQRPTISQQI